MLADGEMVAELFRDANEWLGRLGLRYFLPIEGLVVDISHAAGEDGRDGRFTTRGLTWELDRPF